MLTRVFKSGNSLAVRIPKELALDADVIDVEIERQGDGLLIRPVHRPTLAGLGVVFESFSAGFMKEGREELDVQERDWTMR